MKRWWVLLLLLTTADAQVPPWNNNLLTWTPPTHYADGEVIPAGAIQRYETHVQFNDGVWNVLNLNVPGTAVSRLHIVGTAGKYCYRVVVVSRDVPSYPSDPPVCKVNIAPRPNSVTGVVVQ